MPIRFRFRTIPFIAAMLATALGIVLGNWQMRRAEQKQAIETRLTSRESAPPLALTVIAAQDIDAIEYRRLLVKGEFDAGWPVYLENRPHAGVAGFYLLMPFRIAGSDRHILVARGWLPRDPHDRRKLPSLATPAGMVELQGMAVRNPGRVFQLGQAEALHPGVIVQNLTIPELAQAARLDLLPFMLEQSAGTAQDGLVRDWPRPSSGREKHLGYAVQWYGLALLALIFFIVTGCRRGAK